MPDEMLSREPPERQVSNGTKCQVLSGLSEPERTNDDDVLARPCCGTSIWLHQSKVSRCELCKVESRPVVQYE